MNEAKLNRPNGTIDCSVETCSYYLQGDKCAAAHIKVKGCNSASTSENTECETFIKK